MEAAAERGENTLFYAWMQVLCEVLKDIRIPASHCRSQAGPPSQLAALSHAGLGGKQKYEELQVKPYEKQREDRRI